MVVASLNLDSSLSVSTAHAVSNFEPSSLYYTQLAVAFNYEQGEDERRMSVKNLNRSPNRAQHNDLNESLAAIYLRFQEQFAAQSSKAFYRHHENYALAEINHSFQWVAKKRGSQIEDKRAFNKLFELIDTALEKKLHSFIVSTSQGETTVSMFDLAKIINDSHWVKNLSKLNLECRKKIQQFTYTCALKQRMEPYEKMTSFLQSLETASTNIDFLLSSTEDSDIHTSSTKDLGFRHSSMNCLTLFRNLFQCMNSAKSNPQTILSRAEFIPPGTSQIASAEFEQRNYIECYGTIWTSLSKIFEENALKCRQDLQRLLNNVKAKLPRVNTQVPLLQDNVVKTLDTNSVNWDNIGTIINDFARDLRNL